MRQKIKKFLRLPSSKLELNDILLLILPAAIFFSYYPQISFGSNETMHFDISITLIALVLFALTALPRIWEKRHQLIKSKAVWLIGAFALWNTVSLIWTTNLLRGILTTGVVWLLYIAFLRIIANPKIKLLLPALARILISSAIVISIFAWAQLFFDLFGIPIAMCSGCHSSLFGFPRATALAIEPQFLGSLLLAPILIICQMLLSGKQRFKSIWPILLAFLVTTLFLTLSRGAIYALAIGVLILVVVNIKYFKKWLCLLGILVAGFIGSLLLQGIMATINPDLDESFTGATSKVVHQLSLGIIDLRPSIVGDEASSEPANSEQPVYDGYVAESTDIRLSLNELAIGAWTSTPESMVFGVGIGGSGIAMNQVFPDQIGKREITQNEYTETLLELGIIGATLFACIIIGIFYSSRKNKWLWAIIIAFLAQWFFFSGYPNALHIYIIFMIIYCYSR